MLMILAIFISQSIEAKMDVAKKDKVKIIQRIPSSINDNVVVLNGQYMSRSIQALSLEESEESYTFIEKVVNDRAAFLCSSLGYKLSGFEKLKYVDYGTRSADDSYIVQGINKFRLQQVVKFYAFSKIYCETNSDSLKNCQLGSHNSEDVFFIQTRRKDNCPN